MKDDWCCVGQEVLHRAHDSSFFVEAVKFSKYEDKVAPMKFIISYRKHHLQLLWYFHRCCYYIWREKLFVYWEMISVKVHQISFLSWLGSFRYWSMKNKFRLECLRHDYDFHFPLDFQSKIVAIYHLLDPIIPKLNL